MLSYQMVKDTIDGKKTIIQNPTEKQRQEHENVSYKLLLLLTDIYGVLVWICRQWSLCYWYAHLYWWW